MGKIQVLDKQIAELIAAGEVVDRARPPSWTKESKDICTVLWNPIWTAICGRAPFLSFLKGIRILKWISSLR